LSSYEPTQEFKEPEKPPYFLSQIPQKNSLFEIYFDLENNVWAEWEAIKPTSKVNREEEKIISKKKASFFTRFIPTIETVRQGYVIEANILCKNNILLIGPTGCGKSWLSREVLFKQMTMIASRYKSFSMVFSNNTTAEKTQHFIDSRLEKRKKGIYGPPYSQKYLFFIDDLMMPFRDNYSI